MSASVTVVEGVGAGETRWIEWEVCRIGSRPECELRIDGLPPHALTLQFRDGAYFAFNRGTESLYVDGVEIPSAQASRWDTQQDLQIGSFSVLRLEVDGNPAPAPRPSTAFAGGSRTLPPLGRSMTADQKAKQERIIVAFIGTCLITALMFVIQAANTPSQSNLLDRYESLTSDLYQSLQQQRGMNDLGLLAVYKAVREAFLDEMQYRNEQAVNNYYRARNLLIRRQSEGRISHPELEERAVDFIQERISHLAT